MNTELMFSSESIQWSTPQELFDLWNAKYNFTVDVCADTTNYKVKKYYSPKDDGLAQSWQGDRCWCNPPYGKTIKHWVKKAYDEFAKGNSVIVMLLPARVDTKWFHEYIYNNPYCTVTFIKGRLKFSGCKTSAPFPSMIVEFKVPEEHKGLIEEFENWFELLDKEIKK